MRNKIRLFWLANWGIVLIFLAVLFVVALGVIGTVAESRCHDHGYSEAYVSDWHWQCSRASATEELPLRILIGDE